jgi:hypothetical protein
LVEDRAGDHDAVGLGELLEACGDVDAIAVYVLALGEHVAEVDTDAQAEALILGHHGLTFDELSLNEHRAAHRVDDARELAEDAVSHQLEDAAVMLVNERRDHHAMEDLQPSERSRLVAFHQRRVADEVGRQDCGQPPIDVCCRHDRPYAGSRGVGRPADSSVEQPHRIVFTMAPTATAEWGNILAASALTTFPSLLLFLPLQNRLASGLAAGSVKQ